MIPNWGVIPPIFINIINTKAGRAGEKINITNVKIYRYRPGGRGQVLKKNLPYTPITAFNLQPSTFNL